VVQKSTYENKNTTRRVERNTEFDNRWYSAALPRLYARQVAKYEKWYRATHKGKPPVELPYSIDDIYTNDKVEVEYSKWNTWVNPGSTYKTGMKSGKQISGDEILQAELEE